MRALRSLLVLLVFVGLASAGSYTVRWGDTLGGIAGRFGVPVGTLAAANKISDPNRVREGQVLVIPTTGAAASAAVRTHRVASGETLGAIARRYGTSVARLAQANGIGDPNRVREGAVLRIDGANPTWVCPVQGRTRFIDDFGDARGGGRSHEGVDLIAPEGTPVVANTSGFFKRHSNRRGGHAYYLEGDDGIVYYGAHLSEYVGQNRHVRLGEAIGRVGSSGNAGGGVPHLHFERMTNGYDGPSINPYPLLAAACPRG